MADEREPDFTLLDQIPFAELWARKAIDYERERVEIDFAIAQAVETLLEEWPKVRSHFPSDGVGELVEAAEAVRKNIGKLKRLRLIGKFISSVNGTTELDMKALRRLHAAVERVKKGQQQ